MAKTMDILVSPFVKKDKKVVNEKIGQIVEYINVFSDSRPLNPETDGKDFYTLMTSYDTTENQNVIIIFLVILIDDIENGRGMLLQNLQRKILRRYSSKK